jgi:hypothetical protein
LFLFLIGYDPRQSAAEKFFAFRDATFASCLRFFVVNYCRGMRSGPLIPT